MSANALRFRGGEAFGNNVDVGEPCACSVGDVDSSSMDTILDQGLGDAPIGDGRGVMSDRGPTPGDEATEAGDSPPPE